LIKKILYKYKQGEKKEVAPGYWIEKKSVEKLIEELQDFGKEIFIMDKSGEDIREIKTEDLKKAVFLIGDQDGIPKEKLRKMKKLEIRKISVGPQMYFASQALTIIQNELDRRGAE